MKGLALTPPTASKKPAASIFTIHSTSQRDKDADVDLDRRRQECFLDACALCGRKINEDQNIYMYDCFQAFCSIACREYQIGRHNLSKAPSSSKRSISKGK
ncbi:hypothetical protein AAHA92_20277 [Salvia divinorum]|uniref:FLZ-type domain-containing protein n=1 Tax=Salvia divinorum TaxID=28513 RepID=A0ABD1GGN9_SALDI